MKKIVLTQRMDLIKEYGEIRESIDQLLIQLLIQMNLLPIPISNKLFRENFNEKKSEQVLIKKWLSEIKPDGILLSGGNNIGQYSQRDNTETFLLNWAKRKSVPVLGVCRGMQMMGIYEGQKLKKIKNHVNVRHDLEIIGNKAHWPTNVNSFHNFALDNCPSNYNVRAKALDGVIKAIKHKKLPWEGWMWHPEREKVFSSKDIYRIKNLFS